MTWLALLPKGLAEWGRLAVVALFVGTSCFTLGQCDGRDTERDRNRAELHAANERYLQMKGRADVLAADQRLTDTIAVNAQEEALRDAIATTPDEAPDAVRIRLGCERLRRSNPGRASLPAVCRPQG